MSEMLKTYSISFKGKKKDEKEYDLNFKVAKGVKVTFSQVGDIHKVDLTYDSTSVGSSENHNKNYIIKGSLNVQFFQHTEVGIGKNDPPPPEVPDPEIVIFP